MTRVYRFLATPRWLGLAASMALLATIMVGLGYWQLDRYHQRSAVNARIDAGGAGAPMPLTAVVAGPDRATRRVGPAPAGAEFSRVEVTGVYDTGHEILARNRTLNGVGYEVLTPLVLADGTAVIVDRGWLKAPPGGALALPEVPPAPTGTVTVTGRLRLAESGADAPVSHGGRLQVRRIAPERLAEAVPHPLYGAYLTLETQSPPADGRLTAIPPRREAAWQNGGYVVQWWAFAALTLVGYGYLARREARHQATVARSTVAPG